MLILLIATVSLFSYAEERDCNGVFGHKPYLRDRAAYDKQHQNIAQDTYLFAQISSNSYNNNLFELPENIKKLGDIEHKKTGFAASVFEKQYSYSRKHLIVAFRGTQDWRDWIFGNFLNHQQHQAEELINKLKQRYPEHALIATGHSLGGGLALHVSLSFSEIPAYVFNPAYRTLSKKKPHSNERIVIAEQGDILKLQRLAWPNPSVMQSFESFYCASSGDHGIYKLARCLTHVAAIQMEEAETSLLINKNKKCATML